MDFSRFSRAQGLAMSAVIGLVLFFVGFWLARSTAASSVSKDRDRVASRYEFMQIGDTVAAIDIYTGEAYAIDGNTRAWTLLAPPLPSREPKEPK
ncbi:MAG TPA: hypothetical protein PLD20_09235 [Blastocatellia bacterium]|nr:hypothetical protein [Blastocatellia bacterium]HMV84434.1 hypothetical protein [Blastocatellia bacterium]HMX28703.1 hypothetical protein [Blastocatellia bacterium]HMY72886.1 hypothetical protein [Blastocatellia bacterium]HMZ18101.1 hypothetical protein [Blastocatellia bacterium]